MRFLEGFFVLALVLMLVVCFAASGETLVYPDTTSSVMVASGDSLFALPAKVSRFFDLNDIPVIETVLSSDGSVDLGDVNRVEVYTFGTSDADGIYFRTVVGGGDRNVYLHFYKGSCDSIRVNAWRY